MKRDKESRFEIKKGFILKHHSMRGCDDRKYFQPQSSHFHPAYQKRLQNFGVFCFFIKSLKSSPKIKLKSIPVLNENIN